MFLCWIDFTRRNVWRHIKINLLRSIEMYIEFIAFRNPFMFIECKWDSIKYASKLIFLTNEKFINIATKYWSIEDWSYMIIEHNLNTSYTYWCIMNSIWICWNIQVKDSHWRSVLWRLLIIKQVLLQRTPVHTPYSIKKMYSIYIEFKINTFM